jgi:glycosyltransferase involved in cell wall biosynthesis
MLKSFYYWRKGMCVVKFENKKPSVAILLATYNGSKYLEELLQSLNNQTYSNITVYISDDLSSDSTSDIIQKYVQQNKRFRNITTPQRKGSACKNFMKMINSFSYSEDLYMFCDQDDVWNNDKVEKTVDYYFHNNYLHNNDDSFPVLIHTDLQVVDEKLQEICYSFYRYSGINTEKIKLNRLLVQNCVTGCTMLFNRALYNLASKISEEELNLITMHDHFLAILATAFGRIYYYKESTIKYRQHSNNTVGAHDTHNLKYILKKIKYKQKKEEYIKLEEQAGLISKLYGKFLSKKQFDLLDGFSKLEKKSKITRLCFILENQVLKDSITRNLFEIINI